MSEKHSHLEIEPAATTVIALQTENFKGTLVHPEGLLGIMHMLYQHAHAAHTPQLEAVATDIADLIITYQSLQKTDSNGAVLGHALTMQTAENINTLCSCAAHAHYAINTGATHLSPSDSTDLVAALTTLTAIIDNINVLKDKVVTLDTRRQLSKVVK